MRINPDSPILHSLSVIYDVVVTTFLFLLCCIPVVTVGAALTALQATMMEIAADTSSGVLGRFFGSFRENFKISTLLWLPLMAVGAVVAVEIWGCWLTEQNSTLVLAAMRGLSAFAAALFCAVTAWLFPGIAKYEVTWKQALQNALVWTTRKPLHTLGLLVLLGLMLFAGLLAWLLILPATAVGTYLQAKLLNHAMGFKTEKPHHEEEIIYD